MATENVKVVKIDTKPAEKSLQDLRKELKETRNVMLNTEEGTEEYNKALLRAAEIQHTLKEQMEEVNASAMDFGQIAGNVVKATGGMVAGFQAAKATMNLFGVENEAVLKSLEKMQNLMAITQAIPALDDGFKAFKRLSTAISTATGATSKFGKALVSTGLGALAVALGLIISNFDKISAWLDEITGQTDFLGSLSDKVIGGLYAGWAGFVQVIKGVGNAISTYITAPFKSVWAAIQAYTSTEGGFADKLKAAGKAMKDGFVSEWKEVGNDFKEIGVVAANAYQSGYEKHKANRLAKNVEDAVNEGKEEGKAKGNAKAEAEEAAYKKRLKEVDTQEREEMLKLQSMGLNYEEYVAKKQELEDEFTKKRIEALQNILETEKTLTSDEIATLQDELIKLQDSLYKKPEKESNNSNGETSTEEDSVGTKISNMLISASEAINVFADNPAWGKVMNNISQIANIFDDLNKNHIEKGSKEAFASYAQVASVAFAAIGMMMQGLASEQDTSNKEGFEQSKKYQIAAATMQMFSGIAMALSGVFTTKTGPWDIALAAVQAGLIGAMGAMQIAKIKQTQFNGGGGSTSAGAIPNTGAINSVIAPVQYTQDVQGASIEGAIKNNKVYVTETDISNTQNKVSVTENEARY